MFSINIKKKYKFNYNMKLIYLPFALSLKLKFYIFIIKNMHNTKEFIEKAIEIHGNKYSYEKSNYINAKTKITITCHKHGDFEQTPDNHIYTKKGCKICAGLKKYTTSEIIEKFKKVHGEKYDYSLVDYRGMFKKIKIICKIHGIFEQTPKNHVEGKECGKCHGRNQTTEEIISKFKSIHGETYNYSKVLYENMKTKIIIICPKHGEFFQIPDTHLKGCGCPRCKTSKGESLVYKFLKNNNISFIPQKMFNECRNPTTNRMLPFDFFLTDLNVCIEYDGRQHFREGLFNKNLKEMQYRDNFKSNFCKINNIKLIRIHYKNIDKIDEILKDILLFF